MVSFPSPGYHHESQDCWGKGMYLIDIFHRSISMTQRGLNAVKITQVKFKLLLNSITIQSGHREIKQAFHQISETKAWGWIGNESYTRSNNRRIGNRF